MAGPEESGSPTEPEADPRGDPYLRTRFARPALPLTFLRRERLVRRLDATPRTPLTMVNGCAGAGKTLLVADWAAGCAGPVAWFTTDAADQGPGMFWAYLLQSLRAAGLALPDGIGCPADAGRAPHALLARLAAAFTDRERPLTLVLDEYDRVTDPRIAEQLEFVLHHAGDGLRLVLVTRTEPLLPLHRYRAAGELTEIRDAALAFTPEEAADLLERHGLSLPGAAARTLVDRTRGWAAGLRLCALAARESPDPQTYLKEFEADHSTVADFLLAEVLKRQPPRTQDLLLRVSVLGRFRPELADALTGHTDAGPLLARLARENAFVEHLGHGRYRLHPLFAEILRAHLRERAPGLEPELHRRAAHRLRRSGSLTETLGHGAAAGDWEFTARALVDDLALGQLFTGLRSGDLAALFSRMGPEAGGPAADLVRAARALAAHDLGHGLVHLRAARRGLAPRPHGNGGSGQTGGAAPGGARGASAAGARPGLAGVPPAYAAGAVAYGGFDRAPVPGAVGDPAAGAEVEVAPVPAAPAPAPAAPVDPDVAARLSCALLDALTARLTGSPARAERAAAVADELTRRVPAALLDRHPELTALLLSHLGSARLWAGRFEEAEAAFTAATRATGGAATALPRADSLGRLALIDLLDGRLGHAERRARAAVTETERFGLPQPSGSGVGQLVLAAVAVERDDLAPARVHLDAVAGSPAVLRDPVLEAAHALVTARLHLARGDTAAVLRAAGPGVAAEVPSPWAEAQTALVVAAAHLAEGRPEVAAAVLRAVSGDPAACAVGAARVRLAQGRPRAAVELLDALRPERHAGPAVTVRAALVRAEAAERTGDPAAARRLVAHALHEARPERLRRPFREAGPWLRPLLARPPLRGPAADWLTPAPVPHAPTPHAPAPHTPPVPHAAPAPHDHRPSVGADRAAGAREEPAPPVVERLSGRERDVLRRLAGMMSTEEIAADLYVSVNTVKTHLKSAYRKLGVNRRGDAVRRAREHGLL
ncbi:LuxR C-terminal-related transcriptional regulator [Streptomyces sp. NPDC058417]|uniref:LuxR C-terminal-related transcriptional regulator n=1 Tax=unclassified Streptomyces TaxID=2593676 RepID=UPI0036493B68